MSQQDDLVAAGRRLLTNNYRQAPIVFARGEAANSWMSKVVDIST